MVLDGFIGVCYQRDEEAEHHVDEEGDEGVEVDSAEKPHNVGFTPQLQEGGVHVVPIDQREEALGHLVQCSKLIMIRPEYNPATEAVPEVDHDCATTETDHIW